MESFHRDHQVPISNMPKISAETISTDEDRVLLNKVTLLEDCVLYQAYSTHKPLRVTAGDYFESAALILISASLENGTVVTEWYISFNKSSTNMNEMYFLPVDENLWKVNIVKACVE